MDSGIVAMLVSAALAITCIITGAVLVGHGVGEGMVLIGAALGIVGKYSVDRRGGR